jgi:hypothetical protein
MSQNTKLTSPIVIVGLDPTIQNDKRVLISNRLLNNNAQAFGFWIPAEAGMTFKGGRLVWLVGVFNPKL